MIREPVHTFEFNHSPVDFVVAGPLPRGDGVFIRGGHPGLDIIGHATRPLEQIRGGNFDHYTPLSVLHDMFFFRPRLRIHVVESQSMLGILGKRDGRLSKYILAWRGFAGRNEMEEIEKAFNEKSMDIFMAMMDNDEQRVEWAIAPVIARCHESTTRRIERVRLSRLVFTVTLVLYVALAFYLLMTRR